MRRFAWSILAALAAITGPQWACGQHSDVLLALDGTKVAIGAAADLGGEEGGPFFDLETRVFEGVLLNPALATPPFGFDFERDEPGFFATATPVVGSVLPGNADVSAAIVPMSFGGPVDTLFYWNGMGAVDFQPVSTAQPGVAFVLGGSSPFGTTAADGSLDDHPLFGLILPGAGVPADGVYAMSLRVSVAGVAEASDPITMVWLADGLLSDEETAEELEAALEVYEGGGAEPIVGGKNFAFFEEAVEFAEGNAVVPEPSSWALCGLAALLAWRYRR